MSERPPPIDPAELADVFATHQPDDFSGARFCATCDEDYPCHTARLLAMLVEATARRLWAERQLRAQQAGRGRLAPAPRWPAEPRQDMYRKLARKALTLPEEPTPLTHLRPPF